eukprot:15112141-Alexandrium_andersonii.AAC.1
MSASLVGSEMCIRDRRRAARSVGASPGRRRSRVAVVAVVVAVGVGSRSVSYTHLTLPTICSV